LTTLNHEADRLRRLIDGFLRIATLDAGREPIRKLPTRLNDLIAGIVTNRREAAASRGIALASTLDPALPEAITDAELTTEAIRYLLDNALNYTPHGGHVTIAAALASNAGTDWVTIRISDSGPGIAPDEMPRLFERFYRGAAARDYKTPGVGLSLAICKAIAERVGGRITVESQVGQGASFTLWLKRA
jgi:signal transduction histidine kinase